MRWLKTAGTLLLAILVLVALVAAGGLLLAPSHRAVTTVELAAPAEAVFARISDVSEGATWRTSVDRVEMLTGTAPHPRFREYGASGPLTMEVLDIAPPHTMTTRIADPELPFGGTWTWRVEATAAGCRVTIEERGEIYNPIFRVISRFVLGYNATAEEYLSDLAASFGQDEVAIDSRWSR